MTSATMPVMSDLSASIPSTDEEQPFGWGPSHSEEEEEEATEITDVTDVFSKSDDNPWTWIEDTFNVFKCGAQPSQVEDGPFPYSMDEEDDDRYARGGACSGGLFKDPMGVKKIEEVVPQVDTNETIDTTGTPRSGTNTLNDVSLNSILGSQKATNRAWSTPPRLHNILPTSFNGQQQRVMSEQPSRNQQSVPKFLDQGLYFSDLDTFLSDDFTDMEQGYFNGLYDHICKPTAAKMRTSKERSVEAIASPYYSTEEHDSVLLSFDDTISKLTMDERSYSTETLNTLDRRATIAAIVRAQARGGWRAMAQEEAEAKAEELSRFGIEHTITESRLYPEEMPPIDIERSITESRSSPPRAPAEAGGTFTVYHQPKRDDAQGFENFQPNFESLTGSTTQTETEARETIDDPKRNTSKANTPTKNRFLRPFHRKKKKDKSDASPSKSGKKRSSFLKALTPPRKSKQNEHIGTPTSTTGLSTGESASTSFVDRGYYEHYAFMESSDGTRDVASSSPQRESPKESPTVIEEVEVLERRKEPVYSSYVRSPSYNIVEDVEILRKESDLSNLKHLQDTSGHHRYERRSSREGFLGATAVDEDRERRGSYPPESSSSQFEADLASSSVDEQGFPTDDGNEEQGTDCSSSISPTYRTMTSRLARERVETQHLRMMLEKKDEDFEELREFLHSNESKTVLQRVSSPPMPSGADPCVQ